MTLQKKPALRLIRATIGFAVAAPFLLAADAGAAIDLANLQSLTGQFELSLANSNRRCRIMLRQEAAGAGHVVSMPAGCRRAMPVLASVGAWDAPRDQTLNLETADGKTVLEFQALGDAGFSAPGPDGENYELTPAANIRTAQLTKPTPVGPTQGFGAPTPAANLGVKPGAAAPAPTAPAQAKPAAQPTAAAVAAKPADIAGRYNILRDGAKDTGCMLTLDDKLPGLKGHKAQLAPACRDQGIVIFDPAGWYLEKGRLVLTARKGHQTHLDLQPDGMWVKDAKEGKALAVKKF